MKAFSWITFIASIAIFVMIIIKCITFDINCGDYLKRAADSNTVELAADNLKIALDYIEANGMTSGYTSVVYKSPDEDVAFWYTNIKQSYEELISLDENATNLEKTNLLMKLRETLLDQQEKGESLTVPNAISCFPNNTLWAILKWLCLAMFIGGLVGIGVTWDD
jgi:hypothetical protein